MGLHAEVMSLRAEGHAIGKSGPAMGLLYMILALWQSRIHTYIYIYMGI